MKEEVKRILVELGVENKEILENTPKRYEQAIKEMVSIKQEPVPTLTSFEVEDGGNVVMIGPLEGVSLCPHHLLSFVTEAFFGYLPHKRVLGLSKPARLYTYICSQLGLQEEFGPKFLNEVEKQFACKGAAVLIKGSHSCASIRGVKQGKSHTITYTSRGDMRKDYWMREFRAMIQLL